MVRFMVTLWAILAYTFFGASIAAEMIGPKAAYGAVFAAIGGLLIWRAVSMLRDRPQ